jgi:hypothetical protein
MNAGMEEMKDSIMQMNRAYIDEYDVVQRYIRHTLPAQELEQFEVYILSNPSIINEIEQQKVLNQIFREELPKANKAAAAQGMLQRFRHVIPLAACLVLALYVGILTKDRAAFSAPPAVMLDPLVLQDLRGATTTFGAELPADIASHAQVSLPLRVDVGPKLEPVVTYSVFVRSGTTVVSSQENQQASADGWLDLVVMLPATPASYQVEVVEFPRGESRRYSLYLQ